jgi:glycosyltransferase involved in cell wall biosynthesis
MSGRAKIELRPLGRGLASMRPTRPVRLAAEEDPKRERGRVVRVVLPVFNEAPEAEDVGARVCRFALEHPEFRFTFVDDGSTDGTADRLRTVIGRFACGALETQRRVEVTGYAFNAGKGHAIAYAIARMQGDDDDLVIFTDGDLAYPLDLLNEFVAGLSKADVVIGSRRGPDGRYRARAARNVMGWVYNRLARVCLGEPYRDTQAGIKGFRLGAARRIFSTLRVSGFAFDVEVLFLARRYGYRISQTAVQVCPEHIRKPSKVNLLRDPRRMFVALAGIRLSAMRGQYERSIRGRQPLALMSFDCEEFDLPNELCEKIDAERQFEVAAEGMERALALLAEVPARATFFTTAVFAER